MLFIVYLVNNIEFRKTDNDLQRTMRNDIKMIKQSGKIVVSADKSANLYKVDPEEYQRLLLNNITKEYKKNTEGNVNEINKASQGIAKTLGLADRMERLQETEAYITIKDHKEDFPANPKFRLINPSKTDLGRVSKRLLD